MGKRNLPSKQTKTSSSPHQITLQNKSFSTHFEGPIPPPEILHQYDQVLPGAAERIISMAENQAKHRQLLEKSVIESEIKDSRMGLYFGFLVSLIALLMGTYCIIQGYSISGSIIGGSAVPGLAAVFVYGSRQRRKERETKQRQTPSE